MSGGERPLDWRDEIFWDWISMQIKIMVKLGIYGSQAQIFSTEAKQALRDAITFCRRDLNEYITRKQAQECAHDSSHTA
jgi:hypothetical protein